MKRAQTTCYDIVTKRQALANGVSASISHVSVKTLDDDNVQLSKKMWDNCLTLTAWKESLTESDGAFAKSQNSIPLPIDSCTLFILEYILEHAQSLNDDMNYEKVAKCNTAISSLMHKLTLLQLVNVYLLSGFMGCCVAERILRSYVFFYRLDTMSKKEILDVFHDKKPVTTESYKLDDSIERFLREEHSAILHNYSL